ncbi:hypothetical protein HYN56_02760 [Flavobacterium crocinum]|uniref:Yip1 domain-containing protein n=1 Tax=Flavobacterium crocinum TaxID=2183896 RepID=A0A2S1YGN7_9FLAO|nr:hypothetical protein [Flavobacterium crocinum]AWK03196.1 hypothetical protein HYN56_02760 [Flavobacterium crocinum]
MTIKINIKNTFLKYLLLCVLSILLNHLLKEIVNLDKLLYNSLYEQLTSLQIEKLFEFQKKWQWLNYTIPPIFIIVKTLIISSIIYIGIFLFNTDLKFRIIIDFVLKAEFIFLLVPIFKIIWFYFFQTNYTLGDVQSFYPLSALNIIGYKGLETWFIYPFQILNLFEFFYIIYLGYEIGKHTQTNTDYGLKVVGLSYVPSLFLWIATVMFFTLNYS